MTLAALVLLAALADSSSCPGRTVFERADLEAHGVVAVHDLVRMSGLDAVTVDGYDAVPMSGWGAPRAVRLLVDGAPVAATTALEPLGLEALPLAVGEIARVVVCPGPGLAGGIWGGPWIDIETDAPGRAYAAGVYGNETGDPGPDLYLDPALANVDRWGPDAEAALGATVGLTQGWASVRHHRLIPTDPALARRLFDAVTPDRYLLRSGTSAALAVATPTARVRVGGHQSGDLPFVPAIGRELPIDRRSLQATASVQRRVGPGQVGGHLHVAHLRASRPVGSLLPLAPGGDGPGWSERRLDAAAFVTGTRNRRTLGAGLQGQATWAQGPGLDASIATGRAWASVSQARGRGAESLTLQLTAGDTGLLVGGTATAQRGLSPWAEAQATLALDRQPPDGLAPWLRRGYVGLVGAGVEAVAEPERSETVALARLGMVARPGRVRLAVSAEVQRSAVTVQAFGLEEGEPAVRGTVRYTQAEGTAARFQATARWSPGRWDVSGGGHVQRPLAGDAPFRDAWSRAPTVQGDARAAFRPDPRLTLWSALRVRTSAEWHGVPGDAPATVLLDLGLSKRLWRDHLTVAITGRNVLNGRERTHPLGAVLAPRLFVRATARL